MVESSAHSVFPDNRCATVGSLGAWLGFAPSTLKLGAKFGAVLHGRRHLFAIDRFPQLQSAALHPGAGSPPDEDEAAA